MIQIRPSSLVDGTKLMLSHLYLYLLPQFESLYYLFGYCTWFRSYHQTTCEQSNAAVVRVQLTVSLCSLSSLPLPPPTCTNLTMSSAVCPHPSPHSPPTDQFVSLFVTLPTCDKETVCKKSSSCYHRHTSWWEGHNVSIAVEYMQYWRWSFFTTTIITPNHDYQYVRLWLWMRLALDTDNRAYMHIFRVFRMYIISTWSFPLLVHHFLLSTYL